MRDAWNVLDFIIVSSAYIPYIINSNTIDISALRVLRILRPLRTINNVKDLKLLLNAFFASIPMLCDTFVVLMFVFLVFAIAGL